LASEATQYERLPFDNSARGHFYYVNKLINIPTDRLWIAGGSSTDESRDNITYIIGADDTVTQGMYIQGVA
jgi:hypothetical protein